MTRFAAQLAAGRVPDRPFTLLGQMMTADVSRSPLGTESAWAYTHVPQTVVGDAGVDGITGAWDEREQEAMADRVERQVERYAPGFRSLVRARRILAPPTLQAMDANLHGGAINGGTANLHQQLVFRPVPGTGRPETPVRGLYLASASAHPGGESTAPAERTRPAPRSTAARPPGMHWPPRNGCSPAPDSASNGPRADDASSMPMPMPLSVPTPMPMSRRMSSRTDEFRGCDTRRNPLGRAPKGLALEWRRRFPRVRPTERGTPRTKAVQPDRPSEGPFGRTRRDVMPAGSSPKRERQYEHVKESAEKRGESTGRAKEIAARTVNKERARAGESDTASRTSTRDKKSASQRGGERSHSGAQGPTRDQLYEEARKKGVEGRSSMNKQQLRKALGR